MTCLRKSLNIYHFHQLNDFLIVRIDIISIHKELFILHEIRIVIINVSEFRYQIIVVIDKYISISYLYAKNFNIA